MVLAAWYASGSSTIGWLLELYILATYKDEYRLVTGPTSDDFIVLPHWETTQITPKPDIRLSEIS